jgi:hypothetical protein
MVAVGLGRLQQDIQKREPLAEAEKELAQMEI